MKDILKKVTSGIRTPDNVKFMTSDDYVIEPLIVVNKEYMEILGHKIDDVAGFEAFVEYIKKVNMCEKERDLLHKERDALLGEKSDFIEYIKMKLEESKLLSTYEQGVRYPCIQERIYQDILNRIR